MNPAEHAIGPAAARQRIAEPGVTLLDCREPHELDICRIEGAANFVHISSRQIVERFNELDRDREIIVYCRTGKRSLMVAGFLRQEGFPRVLNLTGGIHAWADVVDPAMPKY